MEGSVVIMQSAMNVNQGTAYLTSERFVLCKRSGMLNALLGPILMHLNKGTVVVHDVPLKSVNSINSIKHGFGKKLVLNADAHSDLQFMFSSEKEKWLSSIKTAVVTNHPDKEIKEIGDLIEFS